MSGYRGHCLCGAVTWAHPGPSLRNLVCHCDDCIRATGAPLAAFVGLSRAGITFSGPVNHYQSSTDAWRGFCSTCGTRLYFRSERWPDEIHMHVGTLADPQVHTPTEHCFRQGRLRWMDQLDGLTAHEGFAKEPQT